MTNKQQYGIYKQRIIDDLGISESDFNTFRLIGKTLNRLYCRNCNGTISELKYEELTRMQYSRADRISKKLGLYIYYQTDPRGATIYLDDKPIPENNYNVAHCIY